MEELILSELRKMNEGIGALKADVAELKKDVAQLKVEVAQLKADVEQLKKDVAQLKADVKTLRKDLDELNKREQAHFEKVCEMFDDQEKILLDKIAESKKEVYKEIRKYHPIVAENDEDYKST